MSILLPLIIAGVLVALCAVFVAAEFSLITASRSKIERLAARGDRRAARVMKGQRSLSLQLSGAQVGITITNLAIGFLAEPAVSGIVRPPLTAIGVPDSILWGVSVVIGVTVATMITMVFGELIPKNLALAHPVATAKAVVGAQQLFTALMAWPIRLLNASANMILRMFGVAPQEELASARSADELLSIVRRSAVKGTLTKDTATLLERSLSFGEHTAADVMTPRGRVKSISADATAADILLLTRKTGLSRFPVTGNSLDDVIGFVHIKHAFAVPRAHREATLVSDIMEQPTIVPASIQTEPLLRTLRAGGLQMAIVIDEFGGTDGIVCIEDLLEELVGDVKDEHDDSRKSIDRQTENQWVVSGLLRIDELAGTLGIALPDEDDFDTVAGLALDRFGHIPRAGESVTVTGVDRDGKARHVTLTVERMEGRRVDYIRMTLLGEYEAPKKGERS